MAAESTQTTQQNQAISEPEPTKELELVRSLHDVLHQYAIGDDFKSLAETLKEVNALRQQIQSTQTAYQMNLIALSKLMSESETKDTQHTQALNAYKKSLDDEVEAKKKVEDDLATMQTNFATKVAEVDELDTQVQKLIKQGKDKETRITILEKTVEQKNALHSNAERQRDALRGELDTATERLEAQAQELAEVSEGLEMIRSCVVPLRTIRDNGESV